MVYKGVEGMYKAEASVERISEVQLNTAWYVLRETRQPLCNRNLEEGRADYCSSVGFNASVHATIDQ